MITDVVREVVSQLPGYEHRPQQLDMAELIDTALREKRHAIIEAGTGSGKSFGYLIPLIESGKTAVISTGTIALQEQLDRGEAPLAGLLVQAAGQLVGQTELHDVRVLVAHRQHHPASDR